MKPLNCANNGCQADNLKAEYKRLDEKEIATWAHNQRLDRENERLRAENARLREAAPRALTMLKAAEDYAHKTADFGLTTHYDEADCDGYCLSDECGHAYADLKAALGGDE